MAKELQQNQTLDVKKIGRSHSSITDLPCDMRFHGRVDFAKANRHDGAKEKLIMRYGAKALAGIFALALLSTACLAQSPTSATPALNCAADTLGVSRTIEVSPGGNPVSPQLVEGEVVLTFDDGPNRRRTRRVLDVLEQECVRATFFLRGDEARRNRKLTREIARRGHTLGGHGWAHADLTKLSPPNARADITRGINGINRAFRKAESPPQIGLFRFPFVARNETLSTLVTELGLAEIGVDIDGQDWTGNSAEEIADLVMSRLEARGRRGIILLHDPFANSVQATELLLTRLKAENYAIVAIASATTD
jgi:peptidoglycan/xylan/chitin deacetylase (PgdA/CDA1 family)